MLKDPVFAALGLLFTLATVVLFVLSAFEFGTGPAGIFTMLLGGLFLLLGFNSRSGTELF
jgi:hypothetical protein